MSGVLFPYLLRFLGSVFEPVLLDLVKFSPWGYNRLNPPPYNSFAVKVILRYLPRTRTQKFNVRSFL